MNHANMLKAQIGVVYYSERIFVLQNRSEEWESRKVNTKFAFNNQALILLRFATDR